MGQSAGSLLDVASAGAFVIGAACAAAAVPAGTNLDMIELAMGAAAVIAAARYAAAYRGAAVVAFTFHFECHPFLVDATIISLRTAFHSFYYFVDTEYGLS